MGNAKLALLCPGQGSQTVGMGADLADAFPEARETFEEADSVLGFPLSTICFEGPEEVLTETRNAQPALLVHAVAAWRALGRAAPAPTFAAGHSLGELSAWVLADGLPFADAVRVVQRRGELMFEAGRARRGAMAAVLGLGDADAERVCGSASEEHSVVVPANYNAPGQIVISGDEAAVRRAGSLAQEAGARRVVPLNVSGAFHSPLMASAESGLADALERADFKTPTVPVLSNVTAEPVSDAGEARRLLAKQLTSPVRWGASIRFMRTRGVSRFLEVGAGSVLTGLLRRIDRDIEGRRTVGTADEIEALQSQGGEAWS